MVWCGGCGLGGRERVYVCEWKRGRASDAGGDVSMYVGVCIDSSSSSSRSGDGQRGWGVSGVPGRLMAPRSVGVKELGWEGEIGTKPWSLDCLFRAARACQPDAQPEEQECSHGYASIEYRRREGLRASSCSRPISFGPPAGCAKLVLPRAAWPDYFFPLLLGW